MNEQNLTQYELAQRSGVPFSTIKSIMQRRTKNISLKTIIMLSKGLGMRTKDFLDDIKFDEIDMMWKILQTSLFAIQNQKGHSE